MEKRENEKVCIFAPLVSKINESLSFRLYKKIMEEKRAVAIDLEYTSECSIEFINMIKEVAADKKIGIFNIPSDIFSLFNVMGVDKFAQLFVSEMDFEENQRQLINRKFSIIY